MFLKFLEITKFSYLALGLNIIDDGYASFEFHFLKEISKLVTLFINIIIFSIFKAPFLQINSCNWIFTINNRYK